MIDPPSRTQRSPPLPRHLYTNVHASIGYRCKKAKLNLIATLHQWKVPRPLNRLYRRRKTLHHNKQARIIVRQRPLTAVRVPTATYAPCKPSVLMVDELLSAYPHQLSFSEAGMRIMITDHFSPRTRLTMASRMLINEVGRRIKLKQLSKKNQQ